MKRATRPEVWFTLALLGIAAAGALLLARPESTDLDARQRKFYWATHYWMSACDALSATCGVGLLTRDFNTVYTPHGRWALTALGLTGALLYLLAAAQAARRLRPAGSGGRWPHPLLLVVLFFALQTLAIVAVRAGEWALGVASDPPEAACRAIALFSSLGWARQPTATSHAWLYAIIAWVAALGWPLWLCLLPPARRRYVHVSSVMLTVVGYTAFLLAVAGLITALETPRAVRGRPGGAANLSTQPAGARYARGLVQIACASGAGLPTEPLAKSEITEGSKFALATVVLVGGLGGSPGGGIKWSLLAWALAGGALAVGARRARTTHAQSLRFVHAGVGCLVLMAGWAVIVALGLLVIETHVASPFQPAPTFADAFLEGCSAVGGANLSAGLTATVTSPNLSSGMGQSHDLYQYGTVWLMLAMLVGRVLPLFVMSRAARVDLDDLPRGPAPLA